jgi:hypothetical protein
MFVRPSARAITGADGRGLAAPACNRQAIFMLTATSCRTLAGNDDLRAAAADLPTQRKRFQDSADAWNERADMLERIGRLDAARRAPERAFDDG